MKTKHLLPLTVALVATLSTASLCAARTDDDRIISTAKQSYVYRSYLQHDHIKIHATDGNVTLTGQVSDPSHKAMAEDTVRGQPGVRNVDNRLVVKVPGQKSDGLIEMKIHSALLFHRSVSATKTKVTVNDGVVTLNGPAESQAQKDLTTEYANDIEGVKSVNNMMTVIAPGEVVQPSRTVGQTIDDASITAEVKSALVTHRSTSALRTEVKTREGVVTVGGKAKNQAEKDLVSKLVEDIRGVTRVENNMEIE